MAAEIDCGVLVYEWEFLNVILINGNSTMCFFLFMRIPQSDQISKNSLIGKS